MSTETHFIQRPHSFALVCSLFCLSSAPAIATPRYMQDLQDNGFLGAADAVAPTTKITSGFRFESLTHESRMEVCSIALAYYRTTDARIAQIEISSAQSQILIVCTT